MTKSNASLEWAKSYWLYTWSLCPGRDRMELPPEEVDAYQRIATRELEAQWDAEECCRLLTLVRRDNPQNVVLVRDAWRRYRPALCDGLLLLEQLKTAAEGVTAEHEAVLLCRTLVEVLEGFPPAPDTPHLLPRLKRLLFLGQTLAERFPRAAGCKDALERCRLKLYGPATTSEAERLYRLCRFRSPDFPAADARERYAAFADAAQERLWDQAYFEELTAEGVCLDVLGFPDMYAMLHRAYSRENAERLYRKMADFRHCLSKERGHMRAEDITSRVARTLWEEGAYDLLERFLSLAEEMLAYDPKGAYHRDPIDRKITEYREKLKEVRT